MKVLVFLALAVAANCVPFSGRAKNSDGSINIPPHIIALFESLLENPEVQQAIHSSSLFQCIDKELEPVGGFTYEFLKQLHAAGNLNFDYIAARPEVNRCVESHGGPVHIITTSPLVKRVKQLVIQHGLEERVANAIIVVLGEERGARLIALLDSIQVNRISSRGESINIPPHIIALFESLLQNPDVLQAIHSSSLYQCIDKELEPYGGFTYEFLKQLHAAGNLNFDYIAARPEVNRCVESHGGPVHIITTSPLVKRVKQLVIQHGLEERVANAIIVVLGEERGARLIALLDSIPVTVLRSEQLSKKIFA